MMWPSSAFIYLFFHTWNKKIKSLAFCFYAVCSFQSCSKVGKWPNKNKTVTLMSLSFTIRRIPRLKKMPILSINSFFSHILLPHVRFWLCCVRSLNKSNFRAACRISCQTYCNRNIRNIKVAAALSLNGRLSVSLPQCQVAVDGWSLLSIYGHWCLPDD